jgi:hypothetical protein
MLSLDTFLFFTILISIKSCESCLFLSFKLNGDMSGQQFLGDLNEDFSVDLVTRLVEWEFGLYLNAAFFEITARIAEIELRIHNIY